jgi:hypothetical protein
MQPDGYLLVEISRELANQWDPQRKGFEDEAKSEYKFLFRDMRDKSGTEHDCCRVGWTIQDGFLWLFWDKDSEQGHSQVNRTLINLSHILSFEVHTNSEEYQAWLRKERK